MNLSSIIEKSFYFKGLGPELIGRLASVALLKKFDSGQLIYSRGDRGVGLHLVAEGKVKIYVSANGGKEQLLGLCEPGDVFGEVAIFLGLEHPSSAQAVCESSTVFFPRDDLYRQIESHPELALSLLAIQAQRLASFTRLFETLTLKGVPSRLAAFLLNLETIDGRVKLNLSKGQLASFLGTSPETISRVLSRLKNAGIIGEEKPYIVILDGKRLGELAAGSQSRLKPFSRPAEDHAIHGESF